MNPLQRLERLGQSVWLDDLSRSYLQDGTLRALIEDDGVSGLTSNPAIFERAISGSTVYDQPIRKLTRSGMAGEALYERLAIEDIQQAADLLRNIYIETEAQDGYVSLEVSPHLATDTDGTIADAMRLWSAVDRPNLLIKIPGTDAGLAAVETLIARGVNINVTLLFSPARYCDTVKAYWRGLECRRQTGAALDRVFSVASFFVSRIDVMVDNLLSEQKAESRLYGTAALTAATLTYRHCRQLHEQERWRQLEQTGAKKQRLLWASTSAKNPRYSEIKYVEALAAKDTINTMPMTTLNAYRKQGDPALRLPETLEKVDQLKADLERIGIDLEEVATRLEREGIDKFIAPFDSLLTELTVKQQQFTGEQD